MAEKKSQHYVPQMYFRNFSNNGKSVGGYVLSNRKYIRDMSINGICKRDYLYGDDLAIEKWLSKLESKWSLILKKIIREGNLNLSKAEWSQLIDFIYISDVRTGYAADLNDDFITKIIQAEIITERNHGNADYANYTDDQIRAIKMGLNIPNAASLRTIDRAHWFFADLTPVLIHNTTSRQFITSDNPVVKYNYLFTTKHYKINYGYGHVGLIIFIPISPSYCLMVYDPAAYKLLSSGKMIEIKAPDQIIELNRLFALNAKNAIYFHNSAREWVVEKYTEGLHDSSHIFNNHILQNDSGECIIQVSSPSIFKQLKLHFFEINPFWLNANLPRNLAGPIRPVIQRLEEQDTNYPSPDHIPASPFHYLPQFD